MCVLDLGLISSIYMFLMLLALNFQWSSRSSRKKALNRELKAADRNDEELKAKIKVRNSILLHHLRISVRDRTDLEAQ